MTVSIVVHLNSRSPLQIRHLLQGLQVQTQSCEVLLFLDQEVELPAGLPADWMRLSAASAPEAWKQGLEQASGEYIGFFQTSALLHHEHLRLCLQALAETPDLDAVVVRPSFVDHELLPVSEASLPELQPGDWPAFCLGSRLLWPIESFVFRKAALTPADLDAVSALPSACDLLPWLGAHKVKLLALPSLQLPVSAFWLTDVPEFRQQQIQSLLQNCAPAELTPSWALPKGPTQSDSYHYLCYQSVCQALRNQGLWQYLEAFQQKHLKATQGARSVMWLVYDDLEPWLPYLHALRENGVFPTVVLASERPAILGSQFQTHYEQQAGLGLIRIHGIPEADRQETRMMEPPGMVKLVMELFHALRPERIHLTSLKLFSLFLPAALENTNTPVYYSLSDDSLLRYRWLLRQPESRAGNKEYNQEWLDLRNRHIEAFLRQQAAAVLVHDAHWEKAVQEAGFAAGSYQRLDNGKALAKLYAQLPVVSRPPQIHSSQALLYEARTGRPLSGLLRQDADRLRERGRILAYGADVVPFVHAQMEAKVWVQGALAHPLQVEGGLEQGLPVHLGKLDQLTALVHRYDVLYTPYLLETLRLPELKRLLTSAVLTLRKKGSWAMRLLNPTLLSSDSFWLSEQHLRPYPLALVRRLLTHAGFEITESETSADGWKDIYLEAELKAASLPLLSLPLATEELENYWDEHPPALSLNETDKVLLLGPHIFKTWMMYRVQCEDMLAITTNYTELPKRQKRSTKFRFRHSCDP
ncbi:MAG: hypothetical protein ACAI44_25405, partial [Candidatus Sericytochromatia bacterium]